MSSIKNGSNGHPKEGKTPWRSSGVDFETLVVTGCSAPEKFSSRCLVPPIVNSASFITPGVAGVKSEGVTERFYEYSRYGNPTRDVLESCLAELEGSRHALAFSSGSAAIFSVILGVLKSGDHIVAMKTLYGGSYRAFLEVSKFGISVDFSKTGNPDDICKLIKDNTKLIWLESPANPTLILADITAISREAHHRSNNIIVAVDNTFMTPLRQRCLDLGADVAIYSCSKYLGGHGDLIMGAVMTNKEDLYRAIYEEQQEKGGVPSPFDCFLLTRSIKTLAIRLDKHEENAMKVASFLEKHPKVERVVFPGLKSHPQHDLAKKQQFGSTGMIGIYIKGDYAAGVRFLTSFKVIVRAASLGSDVSLASMPGKMSQAFIPERERIELGITDNYIRLSVGLESAEALIEDLDQALNKSC